MATFSLLALFAACGGQVTGGGTGGGGSGNGSSSGGGGSTGTGGSGGSCVTVPASSFSQSCDTAADCTVVTTGTLCSTSCDCGNTPINRSGLAQYEADVASITFSACPCPDPGVIACVNGTCTTCDTPGDGCTATIDAGPPSDGGACVDLEPSMFDTSCTTSSDCVSVTLGELCDNGCSCGGSAINVADQAKYDQLAAGVAPGQDCFCPYMGSPVCLGGQCVDCGGAAPNAACPDAGP